MNKVDYSKAIKHLRNKDEKVIGKYGKEVSWFTRNKVAEVLESWEAKDAKKQKKYKQEEE